MRIIKEHSSLRIIWDTCILVLILASILIVPFQLVFLQSIDVMALLVIYIIDLFFLADMVFNFFTSFHRHGIEIEDPRKVKGHYLKTMFPVDLIALFPIDLFFLTSPDFNTLKCTDCKIVLGKK